MVSIGIIMIDYLIVHAKGGASRSGKTTCSNASTLVPRKETQGRYLFYTRVFKTCAVLLARDQIQRPRKD